MGELQQGYTTGRGKHFRRKKEITGNSMNHCSIWISCNSNQQLRHSTVGFATIGFSWSTGSHFKTISFSERSHNATIQLDMKSGVWKALTH